MLHSAQVTMNIHILIGHPTPGSLSLFTRTAINNNRDWIGLTEINFSHTFEGWNFKIKVSTGLSSPEASLLALQMAMFWLPLQMVICELILLMSLLKKTPVLLD